MVINFILGSGFTTWTIATVYPTEAVVQDQFGRWFFTVAGGTSAVGDTDLAGGSDTGITWVAYFGEELIGSTYYAFNREVDAAGATDIQAYEFIQRELRQTVNINDDVGITAGQGTFGTVNGEVARSLGEYVGDTLILAPGVVLRNFDANSTNSINHQPVTADSGGLDGDGVPTISTLVAFPFVAAGNFVFSTNYVDELDVDTIFTVYFDYTKIQSAITIATTASVGSVSTITDSGSGMVISAGEYFTLSGMTASALNGLWLETGGTPTNASVTATLQNGGTAVNEIAGASATIKVNPYQSPGAIIVNDNGGTPLDAVISAITIGWDFDYTNNVQGGRTSGTNAPCTIVAIAKDGAEWIDATFTITAATGINVPINGGDERNYSNPV